MDLWLTVIDKKVAHPNEIQNTKVPSYEGTFVPFTFVPKEGTKVRR